MSKNTKTKTKRGRGRPKSAHPRVHVAVRIDEQVAEYLKSQDNTSQFVEQLVGRSKDFRQWKIRQTLGGELRSMYSAGAECTALFDGKLAQYVAAGGRESDIIPAPERRTNR